MDRIVGRQNVRIPYVIRVGAAVYIGTLIGVYTGYIYINYVRLAMVVVSDILITSPVIAIFTNNIFLVIDANMYN